MVITRAGVQKIDQSEGSKERKKERNKKLMLLLLLDLSSFNHSELETIGFLGKGKSFFLSLFVFINSFLSFFLSLFRCRWGSNKSSSFD